MTVYCNTLLQQAVQSRCRAYQQKQSNCSTDGMQQTHGLCTKQVGSGCHKLQCAPHGPVVLLQARG